MAQAHYPKYIENPALPGKLKRVESPEEHQRINPAHFAAQEAAAANDPTGGRGTFSATETAAQERERCAIIAETYPEGGKVGNKPTKLGAIIAQAIRGSVPVALDAPLVLSEFPKVYRDPKTEEKPTEVHVIPIRGRFARPDVTVIDAEQEAEAKAEGYTELVSKASPVEGVAPLKN